MTGAYCESCKTEPLTVERAYSVTVRCAALRFAETVEVAAPRPGLAETRAMLALAKAGRLPALRGELVEYVTREVAS